MIYKGGDWRLKPRVGECLDSGEAGMIPKHTEMGLLDRAK